MGEMKDKLEGKAKETMGTVTGDDSKKTEGKAQGTLGNVKGAANDAKDTVKSAVDGTKDDRSTG
jgi:uncharacterized protein YjbJ (UPF0337 family)